MAECQAAVLVDQGQFRLQSFPLPEIREDTGLLRVELAGVCASDIKYFKRTIPTPLPIILGHEIVGTIAAAGDRFLAERGLQIGDLVAMESGISCGRCRLCQAGLGNLCRQRRSYGTRISCNEPPHLWGGYSQYVHLASGVTLHRLAPPLTAELGVLICAVIANAIEWVSLVGGARVGDRVVVQGVGQQGLAAVVAAREAGAGCLIATGLAADEDRLALARRCGADVTVNVEAEDLVAAVERATEGAMADLVVDVTGSPAAVAKSLYLLRPGGTLISAGTTGQDTLTPLPLDLVLYRALTIRGVFTSGAEASRRAIAVSQSSRYPFGEFITHRFPLSRAADAIHTLAREIPGERPLKVVLDPWA